MNFFSFLKPTSFVGGSSRKADVIEITEDGSITVNGITKEPVRSLSFNRPIVSDIGKKLLGKKPQLSIQEGPTERFVSLN